MSEQLNRAATIPALTWLRAATSEVHLRLERRVDAVERLSDPRYRREMIGRYAALHLPADASLAPELSTVSGLDHSSRQRGPSLKPFAGPTPLPDFPQSLSRAEALGMLYVLEGSTLGGRMILRELHARGVDDPGLAFLDPYGAKTGERWRSFLGILHREVGDRAGSLQDLARGGLRCFLHAEAILCGDLA